VTGVCSPAKIGRARARRRPGADTRRSTTPPANATTRSSIPIPPLAGRRLPGAPSGRVMSRSAERRRSRGAAVHRWYQLSYRRMGLIWWARSRPRRRDRGRAHRGGSQAGDRSAPPAVGHRRGPAACDGHNRGKVIVTVETAGGSPQAFRRSPPFGLRAADHRLPRASNWFHGRSKWRKP
jgi:hypothetical protein